MSNNTLEGGVGLSHRPKVVPGRIRFRPYERVAAERSEPVSTKASGYAIYKAEKRLTALVESMDKKQLTAAAVAGIEQELSGEYGAGEASLALRAALGRTPKLLGTKEIYDWAEEKYGRFLTYQMVATGVDRMSQLVDLDGDGRLGPDDGLVKTGGDEAPRPLGKDLADRIELNAAVLRACFRMAHAGHKFEPFKPNIEFNTGVWDSGPDYSIVPKPGIAPSAAVEDLFRNSDLYRFECGTAAVIVFHAAMLDLLGRKEFDRRFFDLKIGPWEMSPFMRSVLERKASFPSQLLPGDYTYFENPGVSWLGQARGWMGENAFSVGQDFYYGHGFRGGIVDKLRILNELRRNMSDFSSQQPFQTDARKRLAASVAEAIPVPGK